MLPPNLSKLLSPNLSTLGIKIKSVIAQWIAPLIMEDDGCSLIFAKVTNINIIKAGDKVACSPHLPNQSNCTTIYEPKIGL